MKLEDKITVLKGVGEKREKKFLSIGIETIRDLLLYYPRNYDDQSNFKKLYEAEIGEKATFTVKISSIIEDRRIKRNLSITTFLIEDSSGLGKISFFNMKYVKNQIKLNNIYLVSGKVNKFKGQVQLTNPSFELKSENNKVGNIYPIYSLKKNITNNEIVKLVDQVLNLNLFKENLPPNLIKKYNLMGKNEAIENIHRPKDQKKFIQARNRLVFEELFLFQLTLFSLKNKDVEIKTSPYRLYNDVYKFIDNLSFKLTDGQNRVLEEIFSDMCSETRMNRLLQGDVGSGKTIVAIIAMYLTYLNGYQSAIMVPTEILARQHLESFREILEPYALKVELLVGSTTQKNRDRILTGIYNGEVDILIGTHALIEENVEFKNLGLNITDEQHRFGVRQRQSLNVKEKSAHILVMTATPIPRTLALVLYGDLSISTIDTLPPNRKKIDTIAINETMLDRALNFIKKEINSGRQAYVICPLIEESEHFELDSATEVYENLKENYFYDSNIALLHGRMSNDEKNKVMEDFNLGEINIIVSTTVIEVGVNVPNATVILIYNAERFGLAQLHQLRGRVGRSSHKSYCILYNSSNTKISWDRMKVMTDSTDGFYIANKDLELRGSGDIFGLRQSGVMDLKISELPRDLNILKYAQIEAQNTFKEDKYLESEDNRILKAELENNLKVDTAILN
ncbi:ATP-dependent DNA helicase RecG [Anaerosphaera aminiphila DSM 21120]|uniref:ATP-dependent DNA helicase RecG n=1 Tax=Anaerosphaera aminiphila DSM 21120 TaxID=1120995 RepID=A0A1M5P4A8_9FIRM|nr:ATP-dependent DNA helicase RecG [Anaerosphaera aminiphila]SHG96259.1 ATP-dependent DNA helicase RecG [Anaerosphaera aminiphila DSM 21120]